MSDLLYDPEELARARVLAVLVPGALSSVAIFEPAEAWRAAGYGLAHYRFPGLDGRPLSPALRIAGAAAEIATLAARYPGKPIRLLGYSTGGPIVITAAAQMTGDVRVAAMSSAVEGGGGLATALPGLVDMLRAGWQAQSLRRSDIWMEYYRVLLLGRAVLSDPVLAAQADAMVQVLHDKIVMPDGGKPQAHTQDLRTWRLPHGVRFDPGHLQFFIGLEDSVFSRRQTLDFAARLGPAPVTGYPGQGHLLCLSHPAVFEDVLAFFEGQEMSAAGVALV